VKVLGGGLAPPWHEVFGATDETVEATGPLLEEEAASALEVARNR